MKIIREGNKALSEFGKNKPARFQCKNCDCIFEAKLGEYEDISTQIDGPEYKCVCPFCNTACYTNHRMVFQEYMNENTVQRL